MSVLAIAYLVSSVVVDATEIEDATRTSRTSAASRSPIWDLPVLFFDLVFLIWIYLSLINIMASLKYSGQTFKLEMYVPAAVALLVVLVLVLVLLVAEVASTTSRSAGRCRGLRPLFCMDRCT